jgi:GT2 family glycosyltransferase
MTQAPAVFAVIVTHNGAPWISRAVESLRRSTVPVRIVIADNASTDGTLGAFPSAEDTTVLRLPSNRGFGPANNEAIRHALSRGAEFVFLLNQDADADPDTVERLAGLMASNDGYGILSPLHLTCSGDGVDPQFLAYAGGSRALVSDALRGTLADVYEVEFANAAAWLVRRRVFETVGGFDPLFFMYGEDNDFCRRARFHGFRIGIAPKVRIRHWHGGAAGAPATWDRMTGRLRLQAIQMLKRPDRGFARNIPGLCITWLRLFLHACIECDGMQAAAVGWSLLHTAARLPAIRSHHGLCRKPGLWWLEPGPPA